MKRFIVNPNSIMILIAVYSPCLSYCGPVCVCVCVVRVSEASVEQYMVQAHTYI